MKICLIGNYSGDLDEGMRNTAFYLSKELSKYHQVLPSNVKKVFFRDFWREIKEFNPQIIHYIPGPSVISFIIVKALAFYCKDVKTVISATHPSHFFFSKNITAFIKPDLVLTQSNEKMFIDLGCKTEFLPSGVNIEKFTPVSKDVKEKLREKYRIDKEKFVILHVGSIKEGRNVQLMEKLQKGNNQVVIVGAISTGIDQRICEQLKKSGCLVWAKHFKNIEEIYLLSDCYIFPTSPTNKINSIEMPLSVLEAMSCNLSVITTKFGALPRLFERGDGLFFVENENNIFTALEEIKNGAMVKTREKVMSYSWRDVGNKLEEIYYNLIGE